MEAQFHYLTVGVAFATVIVFAGLAGMALAVIAAVTVRLAYLIGAGSAPRSPS